MWERVATIRGTLSALAQPDPSAIAGILRETAESFSGRFRIPPQRLTGVSLAKVKPDNCGKAATNNLNQLIREMKDLSRLAPEDRDMLKNGVRDLVPLVEHSQPQMKLSWDVREGLRLACKTFMLNA